MAESLTRGESDGIADLANVSALEKEGFTSDEIEKITYKNALRVFKDNIK